VLKVHDIVENADKTGNRDCAAYYVLHDC